MLDFYPKTKEVNDLQSTTVSMISKAYLFLPFFFHFLCIADADFPSANVSASWKNNPSNEKGSVEFYDGCTLRPILLVHNKTYPAFGMGFFRNRTSISTVNSFYLVVFMIYRDVFFDSNSDEIDESASLLVLWSANRDKPVRENATLDFTVEGELVLKDADGSPVWSTDNAYGHSVAGLEISVGGNLMLRNRSNGVVWQSFDHPTDTWLPNQKIYNGQRITARSSWSNLSTGIYYLSMTGNGVCAFLDSNPPKEYANLTKIHESIEKGSGMDISYRETYAQFNFNYNTSGFRFIVMEPNGHLTLYQVEKLTNFFIVRPFVDILSTTTVAGDCTYPRACGRYGICLDGGGCSFNPTWDVQKSPLCLAKMVPSPTHF
ncbi:EP1-like glycoprotein 4 [Actinidia eriantha]|uniref:EP1-like glycoprotein 4 n=1 Tax=Actinidia eriantha TaxID=165200 RepID=UPI00258DF779|nr:EP1-like glycoprotein 4 [Actinidia eriantha]